MAVHVVDHPLIKHKLGLLRENSTSTSEFRQVANELGALLCYEATRNLPLKRRFVDGWAGKVEIEEIKGKKLTVVPILRAGLGLMEGVLTMIPSAKISVLGIFRNEKTLEPVEYYEKFATDMESRLSIILDPMLATGGSMIAAINILKKHGCQNICSLNIVCAPEGLEKSGPFIPMSIFIRPPSMKSSTAMAISFLALAMLATGFSAHDEKI